MLQNVKRLAFLLCAQLLLRIVTAFIIPKPHNHVASFRHQELPFDTAFLTDPHIMSIRNATCTIHKTLPRKRRFWKPWKLVNTSQTDFQFNYQYNEVELVKGDNGAASTAILLVHPIGVGIGRWFYNRLLQSLYNKRIQLKRSGRIVALAPDLLACGSASNPMVQQSCQKLPLFTVSDWSSQVEQFMAMYQHEQCFNSSTVLWCIVSNGGCVPIALDVMPPQPFNVTNIVLSAPPRLSGLLQDNPPMKKVQQSYRTLSGVIVGKLFWWFALRNNGKFVQNFSETNLAADPKNLGEEWTPTCVQMARTFPKSRYSTFAFLAGALQTSCQPAFDALANNNTEDIAINVILGGDKRKNPAKRYA
jgi:hypothetical protein